MVALAISTVGSAAWVAPATATAVAPTWPTGTAIAAGDRAYLVICTKQTTAAGSTIATPSGWTSFFQAQVGSTAAPGNGSGSTRIAVFTQTCAGGESGTHASVAVLNGNSTIGTIVVLRAAGTSVTWTEASSGVHSKTTAGTAAGGTHASSIAIRMKDVVLGVLSIADDTATPVTWGTWDATPQNVTYDTAVKYPATDTSTATGNDSGAAMVIRQVFTTGGIEQTVTPITAATLATSETSGVLAFRVRADGTAYVPPATPTNYTLTRTSNTAVALNWDDMANATQYGVERTVNGGSWGLLSLVGTSNSNVTGMTEGSTYQYRVFSSGPGGESAPTSELTFIAGPPNGTGSGTWTFVGAATGQTPSSNGQGSAAGSFSYAGAATGARTPKGSASGTFAFAGTTSGKRSPVASGVGSFSFAGAATGKRTTKGSSTGTWSFAGAAQGLTAHRGQASGTLAYVGTAAGLKGPGRGTATGSFSYAGAAIGKENPKGSATGTFTHVGVASGDTPVNHGDGAGTVSFTGSATGLRAPKASAAGTFAVVGTTQAKTERRGSATGTFSFAGAAVGKRVAKASGGGAWSFGPGHRNFQPNPSFEIDDSTWSAGQGNFSLAQDSPYLGSWHHRVTSPGTFTSIYRSSTTSGDLEVGKTYYAAMAVRTNTAGMQADKYVSIVNSGGSTNRQSRGTMTPLIPNQWHLLFTSFTAEATDVSWRQGAALFVVGGGNVPSGVTLDYDAVMIVQAPSAVGFFTGFVTSLGSKPTKGSATGSWSFTGSTAAGYRIPKASSSGTWNIAGIASGDVPPNSGLVTGSWSFAGNTPVGTRASRGSATGSFSFTGTGVGRKPSKGSSTGQFTFSGAAAGNRTPRGAATGSLVYVGTTSAKTEHRGSGNGTYSFTGVGVAAAPKNGTASGTWTFTNTQALGSRTPKAVATGTFQFIGSGAGDSPANSGQASGIWSFSGSGSGQKTQRGSASGSLAYAGTAVGDALPNRGTATGALSYSATATGQRSPKSPGAGTLTFTGTAFSSNANVGSSAGSFSFSGAAVGKEPAKGSGTGQMHFAAAATGYVAKRGAASGSFIYTSHAVGTSSSGGAASGSWNTSGAAVGRRVPKASTAGVFSFAGTTSAVTARRGAASGGFIYTAEAHGKRFPISTAQGQFSYTGIAFGGSARLRKVRIGGTMVRVQRRVLRT